MQQQYHLKASCSNGVIEASDQSNRNAVTFGLLLANRRDSTRIQLRITWNGCARLFAFYTFSISQPANRLAGRRRGYKIVSLHFIPIDFNCNGKFVVHSEAFEVLMQKNVLEKLNAIKSVFAICIEFTFCRTEYLHSCNYTSLFSLLNSKKSTSLLFFEHIKHTFFDRVCEMKSQFWHSFKWNVACIEWKSDCIKCKCVSKYTSNTNCEASNGVENRGKFFDSDYFHFVQSQREPKQITARANDIKRVRILIQTDIIAEPPPMMIAICSRLVFYFSRALFLARAPNASPHVYVILFAKQRVWVPHLNWDALHISNTRRYSHRTHSLIMIISANTFRYTKWVKRRNFPFAWNSQTCIVHTILLMGSKFNRKRSFMCFICVF